MTVSSAILFLHVAAALLLFISFAIEWASITYLRKATTSAEAQTWLSFGRYAPLFNGPALGVLILTGGHLAATMGAFRPGALRYFGWIPGSLIGIAIVMLFGITINIPKMRAIRLAIPAGGDSLAGALQNKLLPLSVCVRTFMALSIVFMMATKVNFEYCLLSLLAGLLLGLFFNITILRKRRP